MNLYKQENIATLKTETSGSNIFLKWIWMNNTVPQYVKETMVFYMQEGDSKVVILQRCKTSIKTECTMKNAKLDTNYNICIKAIMKETWPGIREPTICTKVTNTKWEISAFIGSTAGALLALILIILLILMSKKVKKRQKSANTNMNQNSQRQRYDSAFESQFDSVAIREDTSFYDDLITSDISYYDSTYKPSTENSTSLTILPSISNVIESSNIKSLKKRASLIEEESIGGQSCDGYVNTNILKPNSDTYHNSHNLNISDPSPSHPLIEKKAHIMETCIDEADISDMSKAVNIDSNDFSLKIDSSKSL